MPKRHFIWSVFSARLVVVKVASANESLREDFGIRVEEDDGGGHANVGLEFARLRHIRRVPVDKEALQELEVA